MELLFKAASLGYDLSYGAIADVYHKNSDYRNIDLAIYYFNKATTVNIAYKIYLALCYFSGDEYGFPKDVALSYKLMKECAISGNAHAQYYMISYLTTNQFGMKNVEESLKWCKLSAEQGNLDAKIALPQFTYLSKLEGNNLKTKKDFKELEQLNDEGFDTQVLSISAHIDMIQQLQNAKTLRKLKEKSWHYESIISENILYKDIYGKCLGEVYYLIGAIYEEKAIEDEGYFKTAFEYYIKANDYLYESAHIKLATFYDEGKGVSQNFNKAIYHYQKSIEFGIDEGFCYYHLGNLFYWGNGVESDYYLANKYYEKSKEFGFNCQFMLEITKENVVPSVTNMAEYAKYIVSLKLSPDRIYKQIQSDLINDFGDCWDKLQENAQVSLVTSVNTFISLYIQGEEVYKKCDFSVVIMPMAKALEVTLAKYFFSDLICYIEDNHVKPSDFSSNQCFIKYKNGEHSFANANHTHLFSLGALPFIVEAFKFKKNDISKIFMNENIMNYFESIFNSSFGSGGNKKLEIQNYLVNLSQDVYTIKNYRNPAAHASIMNYKDAEICGDYLIKVRKLIFDFLSRLK